METGSLATEYVGTAPFTVVGSQLLPGMEGSLIYGEDACQAELSAVKRLLRCRRSIILSAFCNRLSSCSQS